MSVSRSVDRGRLGRPIRARVLVVGTAVLLGGCPSQDTGTVTVEAAAPGEPGSSVTTDSPSPSIDPSTIATAEGVAAALTRTCDQPTLRVVQTRTTSTVFGTGTLLEAVISLDWSNGDSRMLTTLRTADLADTPTPSGFDLGDLGPLGDPTSSGFLARGDRSFFGRAGADGSVEWFRVHDPSPAEDTSRPAEDMVAGAELSRGGPCDYFDLMRFAPAIDDTIDVVDEGAVRGVNTRHLSAPRTVDEDRRPVVDDVEFWISDDGLMRRLSWREGAEYTWEEIVVEAFDEHADISIDEPTDVRDVTIEELEDLLLPDR